MITFYTTAKPFIGETGMRQRNAIRSWQALHQDVEVILFGDGEGYSEVAAELGIRHITAVGASESGIPRIDSMFEMAAEQGRHELQCYVNCDILLMRDFLEAVKRIRFDRFLMVAQRWDVDCGGEIVSSASDWQDTVAAMVRRSGSLVRPDGIDVFLSKGHIWQDLPPMVVGRARYDNWLIYYCRSRRIPVVDASSVVTVVHQNHDYSHVNGGRETVFEGQEALCNLTLAGGKEHMFSIQDADWRLEPRGVVRNRCRGDSERYAEVFRILRPESRFAKSGLGQFLAEAWCEFVIRLEKAKRGQAGPLIRFLPWVFLRFAGKR